MPQSNRDAVKQLLTVINGRLKRMAYAPLDLVKYGNGWGLDDSYGRHISPRLPIGEMRRFLDGFEQGMNYTLQRQVTTHPRKKGLPR